MPNLKNIRNHNLIQGLIFSFLLLCLFLFLLVFKAYPAYVDLMEQRDLNAELLEQKNALLIDGLSFEEFETLYKKKDDISNNLRTLLQEVDKDFYVTNFANTSEENFLVFMSNKQKSIEEKKSNPAFQAAEKKVERVLPKYDNYFWVNSDYKQLSFINYIENILHTFRLENTAPVGTRNIQKFSEDGKEFEDIYKINLDLELTGKKINFLKFLLFSENVGALTVSQWELLFKKNNEIYASKNRPLQLSVEQKNIYENQIFEIEKVQLKDYIDTSLEISSQDLFDFVANTPQRDEKVTANVNISFYVQGLPESELNEVYLRTLEEFKKILTLSSKVAETNVKLGELTTSQVNTLQKIQSLHITLKSFEKDVKEMKKQKVKSKDITVFYTDFSRFVEKIEIIKKWFCKEMKSFGTSPEVNTFCS